MAGPCCRVTDYTRSTRSFFQERQRGVSDWVCQKFTRVPRDREKEPCCVLCHACPFTNAFVYRSSLVTVNEACLLYLTCIRPKHPCCTLAYIRTHHSRCYKLYHKLHENISYDLHSIITRSGYSTQFLRHCLCLCRPSSLPSRPSGAVVFQPTFPSVG